MRSALISILIIGLITTFPACNSTTQTQSENYDSTLINTLGNWRLLDLGYSEITIQGSEINEFPETGMMVKTHEFNYDLPNDASQGPDSWYVLHLEFDIHFNPESMGGGHCIVSAGTNGYTCAQIDFDLRKDTDGSLLIDWTTLGLLEKSVQTSSSRDVSVSFSNFLRTAGVRPGTNTLNFRVESFEGAKVDQLCIRDSTAIEHTQLGPPDWELRMLVFDDVINIGDQFSVQFELENICGRPVEDLSVHALYPETLFKLVNATNPIHIKRLGSSIIEESFQFQSIREGQGDIILMVVSESNIPPSESVSVAITVAEK